MSITRLIKKGLSLKEGTVSKEIYQIEGFLLELKKTKIYVVYLALSDLNKRQTNKGNDYNLFILDINIYFCLNN